VSGERVRLFVALELPDPVRWALSRWRDDALNNLGGGLRPTPPEALHATLCFLGWRSDQEVEAIGGACAGLAVKPPPPLSVGEAVWLPPRRPRALAVLLNDASGELSRAQASLARVLAAGGWYEAEKRPYLPHVSVARLGRGANAAGESPSAPEPLSFRAERVTLYRSRLTRSGALYERLKSVELAA
jgi:RNA 2',3'-cyclic 3'-phosphodiesterase